MKQSIQETAEKVLERKPTKNNKKGWFHQRCDEVRQEKNEARIKEEGQKKRATQTGIPNIKRPMHPTGRKRTIG